MKDFSLAPFFFCYFCSCYSPYLLKNVYVVKIVNGCERVKVYIGTFLENANPSQYLWAEFYRQRYSFLLSFFYREFCSNFTRIFNINVQRLYLQNYGRFPKLQSRGKKGIVGQCPGAGDGAGMGGG